MQEYDHSKEKLLLRNDKIKEQRQCIHQKAEIKRFKNETKVKLKCTVAMIVKP